MAALFAFLAFLLSQIVLIPVIGKDQNSPPVLALGLVATLLWQGMIVWIAFGVARRKGGGWAELGLRLPFSPASLEAVALPFLRIVGRGVVTAETITIGYGAFASATGLNALEPRQQLPEQLFTSTGLIALTGFAVVVTAPIAEEILFRGTIFAGLNRAWGFWPAAFASGLLFAVAHSQSGLIIPFTLVGVTLAYVYRRAGSIYANMSVHFLFNFASFSLLLLFPSLRQ